MDIDIKTGTDAYTAMARCSTDTGYDTVGANLGATIDTSTRTGVSASTDPCADTGDTSAGTDTDTDTDTGDDDEDASDSDLVLLIVVHMYIDI